MANSFRGERATPTRYGALVQGVISAPDYDPATVGLTDADVAELGDALSANQAVLAEMNVLKAATQAKTKELSGPKGTHRRMLAILRKIGNQARVSRRLRRTTGPDWHQAQEDQTVAPRDNARRAEFLGGRNVPQCHEGRFSCGRQQQSARTGGERHRRAGGGGGWRQSAGRRRGGPCPHQDDFAQSGATGHERLAGPGAVVCALDQPSRRDQRLVAAAGGDAALRRTGQLKHRAPDINDGAGHTIRLEFSGRRGILAA